MTTASANNTDCYTNGALTRGRFWLVYDKRMNIYGGKIFMVYFRNKVSQAKKLCCILRPGGLKLSEEKRRHN
jgi:hypothetical protein